MKISVIHPTRHRWPQALKTQEKWLLNADSDVEYLFSYDEDDMTRPKWITGVCGPNKTAIGAINRAADVCTGDLIVVVSDDFDCDPHWDTALRKELEGLKDFVLKTRDGIQKVLVTLPILDRVYYERVGYIYHPEFKHMGCDVELTAVAIMTGKLLFSDLLFRHLHYSAGLSEKDAINERNDLTYKHGDEVLAKHKENNFGIPETYLVMEYSDIVWH